MRPPLPLLLSGVPRFELWPIAGWLLVFLLSGPLRARDSIVPGELAILRGGIASAPAQAPAAIQKAIWAVNGLSQKPYRWGGGHATFLDRGYDCSGTISFLLHAAGCLESPTPSRGMMTFGASGLGRWITIYAKRGHVYAVVAGLRLDTTDMKGGREGPRWHVDSRNSAGFEPRHPPGL